MATKNVFSVVCFVLNSNKTAGHIFRSQTLLKISFRRMKAFSRKNVFAKVSVFEEYLSKNAKLMLLLLLTAVQLYLNACLLYRVEHLCFANN